MTVTISYETDAELARKCAQIAKRLSGWHSVKELQAMYGCASANTISMRLDRFSDQGGELICKYGISGRKRLSVKLTPDLDSYMRKLSGVPAQDKGEAGL